MDSVRDDLIQVLVNARALRQKVLSLQIPQDLSEAAFNPLLDSLRVESDVIEIEASTLTDKARQESCFTEARFGRELSCYAEEFAKAFRPGITVERFYKLIKRYVEPEVPTLRDIEHPEVVMKEKIVKALADARALREKALQVSLPENVLDEPFASNRKSLLREARVIYDRVSIVKDDAVKNAEYNLGMAARTVGEFVKGIGRTFSGWVTTERFPLLVEKYVKPEPPELKNL